MGAPKVKTIGGGSAAPTADAFNKYLLESLNSGAFSGMMSGQNNPSPLSFNTQVDMSNPQFAAMNQMLQQQQTQNVAGLRERFGGASARGTPGAFAEASYLSQANPQNILAMGQLANQIRGANLADLQAQGQYDIGRMGIQQNQMEMMMRAMMQAQGLGTPQAQVAMQPSGFSQALGAIGTLAPYALAPFTGGASLGIPGMMSMSNPFARKPTNPSAPMSGF